MRNMKKQNSIRVFGLTCDERKQLQQMALIRYGKSSASLMLKKLAKEHIKLPETPEQKPTLIHQENIQKNPRFTVSLIPIQYHYLLEKAKLQHSSLNDVVRDIITEHITQNPVLNNDEVQALYQSNYQLLRLGRNVNQLARHFNAILPESITTYQLNQIADFLEKHTQKVGKILRKQGISFKYRPIRALNHETTESTN